MNGFQVDTYLFVKNIEKIRILNHYIRVPMITIILQDKCFKSIVQQIFSIIICY